MKPLLETDIAAIPSLSHHHARATCLDPRRTSNRPLCRRRRLIPLTLQMVI